MVMEQLMTVFLFTNKIVNVFNFFDASNFEAFFLYE